ncbi:MAG: tRNA(Ile)-lysidine synthase [Turneriella sp.]|nr:tRNA(Ile)-lysidine synthase [Turneriella sp.]
MLNLLKTVPEKKVFIVAFSGGADSVLAAHLIHKTNRPFKLWYLHHYPTPIEQSRAVVFSAARARYGENIFIEEKADVSRIARRLRTSWEHAASLVRKRRLLQLQKKLGAQVVTGHNLSDYYETLLLRRERGIPHSALPSLSLIDDATQFMRPLYRMTRYGVRKKAAQWNLNFFDDPENYNLQFARNRIRMQVTAKVRHLFPQNADKLSYAFEVVEPLRELRMKFNDFSAVTDTQKARIVFRAYQKLGIVRTFTKNDFVRATRLPFLHPPFFAHEETYKEKKYIVFRRGLGNIPFQVDLPSQNFRRADTITRGVKILRPYGHKSVTKILSERKLSLREKRLTRVYLENTSSQVCTKVIFANGEILAAWRPENEV